MNVNKSIRQQFADTFLDVGQKDKDLVVVVGDISHGILQPFAKACPGRFFNIGILEPTTVSLGAGMASVGLYPVLHTIAPFLIERAFEQIKLDFCYHNLHGNLVTVGSAFDYSNLGCTHHCYGDFALLKTLPNMEITYPGSAVEFDTLFRQCYRNTKLSYYRVPGTPHGVEFKASDIELGKGIKVADGGDITLVATGPHLKTALGVRDRLSATGLSADIIYIHTIRPLDVDSVHASVDKTRKVVVIEEHMRSGGLGDEVLRETRDISDVKYASASIPDQFITGYGEYHELCESVGLTVDGVMALIQDQVI